MSKVFFKNICLFIWLCWVFFQHTGSLVVACGIWFPDQRSNPGPPALRMWSLSHQGSPNMSKVLKIYKCMGD